ncbi:IclR family transcriptional regulator [Natrinema halophilum]|uniref:IclR family transcriptional regulator n=1 Tax=Natrinema halophilum TaxID=1699371 RepID=UPI001F2AB065|nr:IclR family transcriptional regulator [Natrinema halophilum]UHQ96379.1 IclR family transcriptional regulator [Natrinema halophilum]
MENIIWCRPLTHTMEKESQTIQAGEKLLTVIEAIQELDGARVSELADHLGYTKSTVHRYLATLESQEYVVKERGTYHIGLRFLDIGEHAATRKKAYTMAESKVAELAEETQERAQFVVEEHGKAVYVHREIGNNAVRTDPGLGKRIPIHAAAAGKAILAYTPEEKVQHIIETRGLPAMTEHTITDPEELFEDLELTRDRGYTINENEILEGLSAIGVAIQDENERAIGALSVSGPTHRMKGEWFKEDLPSLLMGTANELELNTSHSHRL